jgi:hypothetical protein
MSGNHGGVDYDYGYCPCTGTYEHRFIEVELSVAQRNVVIKDIPQGECPICGSQVYKMQVMERIETLMRADRSSERT